MGSSSWELAMGALAFALKIHFPSTNSLFRFYVSDCLHLHPLEIASDSELYSKGFPGHAFSGDTSMDMGKVGLDREKIWSPVPLQQRL